MPNKVFNLKLDLNGQVVVPRMQIRRNDYETNIFAVQVLQNGVPVDITGWTPIFECLTPAKKFIRDDGSESGNMNIINATEGKIEYTVTDKIFASLGDIDVAYFAFEKFEDGRTKRVSTGNFYFTVITDVMTGKVKVEDYLSQITALINDINQIKLEYETLNPENYAPLRPGNKFEWRYNPNTESLDLVVL